VWNVFVYPVSENPSFDSLGKASPPSAGPGNLPYKPLGACRADTASRKVSSKHGPRRWPALRLSVGPQPNGPNHQNYHCRVWQMDWRVLLVTDSRLELCYDHEFN
jgi:hypothetical protein